MNSLTSGCSLLVQNYRRPGTAAAHPSFAAVLSRGSRAEDEGPGPGARPQSQPCPSPVLPPGPAGRNVWEAPRPLRPREAAVGKPVPRLPEGRRGGAGSSRSQVPAGTSPPAPTRPPPPPPARQVSGRAAALLFSSTSWRKMLCRAHITHPVHTRAPLRAEQRAGPGRPRSARVSAGPADTSRDSGTEGSRPAKLSSNFAERGAGVAAAPVFPPEASP